MIKSVSVALIAMLSITFLVYSKTMGPINAHILADTIRHKDLKSGTLRKRQIRKETDYNCVVKKRYTIKQRRRNYPFYKAVKILAVSYQCCPRNIEVTVDTIPKLGDSVMAITKKAKVDNKFNSMNPKDTTGLNVENGVLNRSSLKEIKELSSTQIDELTELLYNTTTRTGRHHPNPSHACFNPRDAFVFFDRNGKVFDFLEVCFECNAMQSLSDKIWFRFGCDDHLELLRKLFIRVGIQYGTLKE